MDLAHQLGLQVTVEGVETETQHQLAAVRARPSPVQNIVTVTVQTKKINPPAHPTAVGILNNATAPTRRQPVGTFRRLTAAR